MWNRYLISFRMVVMNQLLTAEKLLNESVWKFQFDVPLSENGTYSRVLAVKFNFVINVPLRDAYLMLI